MKPDEIKWNDWQRIFLGEVPGSFYLELIVRTLILFVLLVIAMRFLGRRMAARISRIELTALFTLAAATGVPLQAPDRGLLPAIVIAIVVIIIGRLVAEWAFKDATFERNAVDNYTLVVQDGILQMHEMKRTRLTIERVFAHLRGEGIRHLGEVKRLYFEANGSFSLVRNTMPSGGLAVIPAVDRQFLDEQRQDNIRVCRTCGKAREKEESECRNCNDSEFLPAVV